MLHLHSSACGQQCDKSADVDAAGSLCSCVVIRLGTVSQVSVAERDNESITDRMEVPFLGDCDRE